MRLAPSLTTCLAFAAGAATVFGFAPFRAPAVPLVTLALLLALWQGAPRPRAAAWLGFAFGVGLFGAGVSWVYIALNTFGGMPAPLAAIGTAGFVAYLALFPAAAGWLATRWTAPRTWQRAVAARRRVGAGRMDPQLAPLRLPLAVARLRAAAREARSPATRRSAACSLVTLARRAGRGCARARHRRARCRRDTPRDRAPGLDRARSAPAASRSDRSNGRRRRRAASRSRSCRATSRRSSSSIRPSASAPSISTRGSLARRRGRLVVLPESAFPVFADEVPGARAAAISCARPRRATATCWSVSSRSSRRFRAATSRATTTAS